jgi:hypothetical protein
MIASTRYSGNINLTDRNSRVLPPLKTSVRVPERVLMRHVGNGAN